MPPRRKHPKSIHASVGLNKNVSLVEADALKNRFMHNPANGSQHGYFLGIDFLARVVADLKAGQFDGLRISFGESLPEPGETAGKRQLIARQIQFKTPTGMEIGDEGQTYVSIFVGPTEPSGLGSPPLGNR